MASDHDSVRFTPRITVAPFAWLGVVLVVASVFALAVPLSAPSLALTEPVSAVWNPFHAVVELKLPGAGSNDVVSLAEAATAAFPDHAVETHESGGAAWIVVTGDTPPPEPARDLQGLARDRGLKTGTFSMGRNIGRLSARVLDSPAAALDEVGRLLPLALLGSGGVLLLFGALLRRRLPPELRPSGMPRSIPRRVALGLGCGLLLALLVHAVSLVTAKLVAPISEQSWLADALEAGGARWFLVLVAVAVMAAQVG